LIDLTLLYSMVGI